MERTHIGERWASHEPGYHGPEDLICLPGKMNEDSGSIPLRQTEPILPFRSGPKCPGTPLAEATIPQIGASDVIKNNNNMLLPASPLIFLGGRPEVPKVYYHLLQKMYLCSAVRPLSLSNFVWLSPSGADCPLPQIVIASPM